MTDPYHHVTPRPGVSQRFWRGILAALLAVALPQPRESFFSSVIALASAVW